MNPIKSILLLLALFNMANATNSAATAGLRGGRGGDDVDKEVLGQHDADVLQRGGGRRGREQPKQPRPERNMMTIYAPQHRGRQDKGTFKEAVERMKRRSIEFEKEIKREREERERIERLRERIWQMNRS
jgi:hypothetical protein